MKFLDDEQREQTGFSFVMNELEIATAYGQELKHKLKPCGISGKEKLKRNFDDLEKVIKSYKENPDEFEKIGAIFCRTKDIRTSIKRCSMKEVLDEVELYEIKYLSMLCEEIRNIEERLELDIESIKLKSMKEVFNILDPDGKALSTFYIYDGYSERLKEIRELKSKKEKEIYTSDDEKLIEKLKEERLDIVILEEEEELKIRNELTEKLSYYADDMFKNLLAIGSFDFLVAKARLAMKYNCSRPHIEEDMHIRLKNAFNPEIKSIINKKKKIFTPVNIDLNKGTTVITGANMGGKSVTLKTIVLNVFLVQMGFYVFAEEADIPILDFVHFVSDDMQSVSKGLSTFGAEIMKLKEVVECTKRGNGFIALDEFARGTNPKEGYNLVKAVAEYLKKFNTISIISTHYDGVASKDMDHYEVVGLKNVNFENLKQKIHLNNKSSVELLQENMEYRLEKVSGINEVPKDALNIAMLLGLDDELVNIAKSYYNEEENHGK